MGVCSRLSALLALGVALVGQPAWAQVSDSVVRIGVLTDQSGTFADIAGRGSVIAAEMAAEDFGAIEGAKIEVINADHLNKPDVAGSLARGWFDADKVDVVVDLPFSSVALAVQQIAQEKNKLALLSGAGSSEVTGKSCTETGIQWTWDTYSYANGTVNALLDQGGKSWFFISVDSSGMLKTVDEASAIVLSRGGSVAGTVRHPLNSSDFSSYLLQAQASGADVIALANGGSDFGNTLKQAREFGIEAGGQKVAGLLTFFSDISSLGARNAQGIINTTAFYWNQSEAAREWSKRFMERSNGRPPTEIQAGVYSAVSHYLKAVKSAGTDDTAAVNKEMRKLRINDFMTTDGWIREDGRVMRDMYLVQVKPEAEMESTHDLYKVIGTIKAEQAFKPASQSQCPLLKK